MPKLNDRQAQEALDHLYSVYKQQGFSENEANQDLGGLGKDELSKVLENAFVEKVKTPAETPLEGLGQDLTSSVAGLVGQVADTALFGHAAGVISSPVRLAQYGAKLIGSESADTLKQLADNIELAVEDTQAVGAIENPKLATVGKIGGYFTGGAKLLLKGTQAVAGKVATKVIGEKVAGEAFRHTAGRVGLENLLGGAAAFGGESLLRGQSVEEAKQNAVTGGLVSAALPAAVSGGVAVASSALKGAAKLSRSLYNASPEVQDLIENMPELVKARPGLLEKGQQAWHDVSQKFGEILGKAKEATKLSPEEQQIMRGTDLGETLSGLTDDLATEFGKAADEAGQISKEEVRGILGSLAESANKAKKVLGLNYKEASVEGLSKDTSKYVAGEFIQPILDSLPQGAIIEGKANTQMLGKELAGTIQNLLGIKSKSLTAQQLNQVKVTLGNAAYWDRVPQGLEEINSGLKDSFFKIRESLTQANPELDKVFSQYSTGLKLADKFKSQFGEVLEPTAQTVKNLKNLSEAFQARVIKPADEATQQMLIKGIRETQKLLDLNKYAKADGQAARALMSKTLKAPDPARQRQYLSELVQNFGENRKLDQALEMMGNHQKLTHALLNPLDAEAKQAALSYLETTGNQRAKPIFESALAKKAKLVKLKDLPKNAHEFIKQASAERGLNKQLLSETSELAQLIPELDNLYRQDNLTKLLELAKTDKGQFILGGGLELIGALDLTDKLHLGTVGKVGAKVLGGALMAHALLKNPAKLEYLNQHFKLFSGRAAMEKAVSTLSYYNQYIRPALQAEVSKKE